VKKKKKRMHYSRRSPGRRGDGGEGGVGRGDGEEGRGEGRTGTQRKGGRNKASFRGADGPARTRYHLRAPSTVIVWTEKYARARRRGFSPTFRGRRERGSEARREREREGERERERPMKASRRSGSGRRKGIGGGGGEGDPGRRNPCALPLVHILGFHWASLSSRSGRMVGRRATSRVLRSSPCAHPGPRLLDDRRHG